MQSLTTHAQDGQLRLTLFSFGFKHGHALADMVWDVRFLPNPYWEPSLRDRTGMERAVAEYVLKSDVGQEFLAMFEPFLLFLLDHHKSANRRELSLAIGCTGGRHRSVAVTEHLQQVLNTGAFALDVFHRDIDKE